jgi:predicted enzyme related to lactoylglutathione lyase
MPRVKHFAIPADQPERAIGFYESVLGWKFEIAWEYDTPQGREKFWRIRTGDGSESGIDGGLTRKEYSGQPITVGVEVEDIDARLALVTQHGGKIIVPKVPLPDGSRFALIQDSEENTFALTESAASI